MELNGSTFYKKINNLTLKKEREKSCDLTI